MSHKPWYPVKIDPPVQRMAKPKFLLPHLNTEEAVLDAGTQHLAFLHSQEPGGKDLSVPWYQPDVPGLWRSLSWS